MNLTTISDCFLGRLKRTKELYFTGSPDADKVPDSTLVVVSVAKGKFLSFTYRWSFKDEEHEGFLLIGSGKAEGVATAAWVDSFHIGGKIMACEGTVDEHGCVSVLGSYEAPPDPDWGWRIEVVSEGKSLRIIMHNISPDEQEVLAVRATYERTLIESALVCCETPINWPRDLLTDRFKCCLQHRQISEQLYVNRAT